MEPEAQIGGTVLGRFRIETILGRGGMATVFSAFDEKRQASVALKLLKRELTRDPMVLRRFEREAKAASHLRHPNVIEILDWGVEGEDAFIAMELASGIDLLRALSQERPMRQTRAALILSQVCSALTAAHAKGIVHRDLKPENILLVPEPEELGKERAKVLDFGIAKILDLGKGTASSEDPPSYVTKTALTRVGTIVGTPAYMSPEQCRGGDIDGRSDIYACGVLLYQLVTGELPFSGETPLHTAMRHIHAQPRNPSELRRGLAPAIERTILKALAKWPGERQQTAEQLREELYAALPTLPDRGDLVLPEGARRDAPKRISAAPGERTPAITSGTGGLGTTPLRGVRLNRAAHPAPTEKNLAELPLSTKRDAPAIRAKDARNEDDDDEPRTFLIPADKLEGDGPSTTIPETAMPSTAIPSTTNPAATLPTNAAPVSAGTPSVPAERSRSTTEKAPLAPKTPLASRAAPARTAASPVRGSAAPRPELPRRPSDTAPKPMEATPKAGLPARDRRPLNLSSPTARSGPANASASAGSGTPATTPTNTETGLTPTALQHVGTGPGGEVSLRKEATALGTEPTKLAASTTDTDVFGGSGASEVDDDEPATFIRDPGAASVPSVVRTLVMDEPQRSTLQSPNPSAVSPTAPAGQINFASSGANPAASGMQLAASGMQLAASGMQLAASGMHPVASGMHPAAAAPAGHNATNHPPPSVHAISAPMHAAPGTSPAAPGVNPAQLAAVRDPNGNPLQAAPSFDRNTGFANNGYPQKPQPSVYPQAFPMHAPPSHDADGMRAMAATARMNEEAEHRQPEVKSTVRMNPQETMAKAAAGRADRSPPSLAPLGGWNESTVARRRPSPKAGLVGQIDSLTGSTGMLIGIGLGLAFAAVGLALALILFR